jgi:hypothetical protein
MMSQRERFFSWLGFNQTSVLLGSWQPFPHHGHMPAVLRCMHPVGNPKPVAFLPLPCPPHSVPLESCQLHLHLQLLPSQPKHQVHPVGCNSERQNEQNKTNRKKALQMQLRDCNNAKFHFFAVPSQSPCLTISPSPGSSCKILRNSSWFPWMSWMS